MTQTLIPERTTFKFRCDTCAKWTVQELQCSNGTVRGRCTHCGYELTEPLDDYAEHKYLSMLSVQYLLEHIHPELAALEKPGDAVQLDEPWSNDEG